MSAFFANFLPRYVLVKHIGKYFELQRLKRNLLGFLKFARFVVRQIELPQKHRLGRSIETTACCEAAACIASPCLWGFCPKRAREKIFRRHLCFFALSHTLSVPPGPKGSQKSGVQHNRTAHHCCNEWAMLHENKLLSPKRVLPFAIERFRPYTPRRL